MAFVQFFGFTQFAGRAAANQTAAGLALVRSAARAGAASEFGSDSYTRTRIAPYAYTFNSELKRNACIWPVDSHRIKIEKTPDDEDPHELEQCSMSSEAGLDSLVGSTKKSLINAADSQDRPEPLFIFAHQYGY